MLEKYKYQKTGFCFYISRKPYMVRICPQQFEQLGIGDGNSLMYLNGLSVDLEAYDIFTLLDVMSSEAKLVEGLHSLGLKVFVLCF